MQMMETDYPEDTCPYCMQARHLMPLGCGSKHRFCSKCLTNMIKITRVKKGLVKRFQFEDAIKCPDCAEIVVL